MFICDYDVKRNKYIEVIFPSKVTSLHLNCIVSVARNIDHENNLFTALSFHAYSVINDGQLKDK